MLSSQVERVGAISHQLEIGARNNFPGIGDLPAVFKNELEKTLQSVNELLAVEPEDYEPVLPITE